MHSRKRLFIGLFVLFTLIVLMALAYLVIYLRKPDTLIYQYSIYIIIGLLAALAGTSLLVLAVLVISLLKGKPLIGFNRLVQKTLVFFFPLLLQMGKLLRISTEQIQSSFIEINNKLVEAKKIKIPAQKLLLLLPHCLQNEACPHKITRNPFNCNRCGSCSISRLIEMADQWQFQIQVVTGGTLAREAVRKLKPYCILAVACERDLSSGIVDSYPMPVCGVLNERPQGPCFNTMVCLDSLEEKVKSILE